MKRQVKVGRRIVTPPSVKSMTDSEPAAPAAQPGQEDAKKPTDEPSDDLIRIIKAAYQ